MPDLVVCLEKYEREALETMAEFYGVHPNHLATVIVRTALDNVVCCAAPVSPSDGLMAPTSLLAH